MFFFNSSTIINHLVTERQNGDCKLRFRIMRKRAGAIVNTDLLIKTIMLLKYPNRCHRNVARSLRYSIYY